MIAVTYYYYSWLGDDEVHRGLARDRDSEWAVVDQAAKTWALDPELLGLLLDGDMSFEEIEKPEAEGLARKYGVELDAAATERLVNGEFLPLKVSSV